MMKYMACVKDITFNDFSRLLDEKKNFIIELWAEWCHPCKIMAPYLEEACQKLNACYFYKINVDENPEIVDLLNVNSIPRIIMFVDGQRQSELKGFHRLESIIDQVSKIPCDTI
ncbi:MAG: thioredoxin family protein [Thermoplasma sp.]|nr:MAG: thioredoxin family protein [Thermoplasma sp.]